jgi:phage recombination protein Bet
MDEAELIGVLESSLYPGAKADSIKLVIAYCRASKVDPMMKAVHIVPMRVKQKKRDDRGFEYVWRDVVMPGIELYRIRASRTAEYVGMDAAEWGPDVTKKLGTKEITFPAWCQITVYRVVGGERCAFNSGRVRWLETYATKGVDDEGNRSEAPNAMWEKRAYGQLEKCAEALALRRAFPELGAQPTAEELEGRIIEADPIPPPPQVEGPKPKATPSAPGRPGAETAPPPHHGGGDGVTDGAPEVVTPLRPSQAKVIFAKLHGAGLTELDLETGFQGRSIGPKDGKAQFSAGDANTILEWIGKNAKGG